MHRSVPNRLWRIAGQLLFLLLLFPALAETAPDRSNESLHTVQPTEHTPESTHDCCLSDTELVSDKEKSLDHCTGTFFCTCSLQATPSSRGAVPTPDQPLTNRSVTSVDLLPTPINDTRLVATSALPGTPPPIWLAHQALLN